MVISLISTLIVSMALLIKFSSAGSLSLFRMRRVCPIHATSLQIMFTT